MSKWVGGRAVIAVVLAWLLLGGCAARGPVADLVDLDQDPAVYAEQASFPAWKMNPLHQQWLAARFMAEWFSVWNGAKELLTPAQARAMAGDAAEQPGLGPNLRPHPKGWLAGLWREADLDSYPNAKFMAITTRPCNLRVLPTALPDFESQGPGGGYPFDRIQQTSLPPGLPLWVVHQSASGAWWLAASPWAWGWVRARDVAAVDAGQAEQFQAQPMLAVTRDQTPLRDQDGRLVVQASMGALFPLLGRTGESWLVLAALRRADGRAELVTASLPLDAGARFPLAMGSRAVAGLASGVAGQAYGWGGMYGLRDCSALTKDLMAPFGLWLDRNSSDQAKGGVRYIDLSGMSASAKERVIQTKGIPFLSLLWMPGHVMLYIGEHQGRALVFHNLWALRMREGFCGEVGRLVIGQAVVTSLTPGAERIDLVRPEGLLIERIEGLVLLALPGALGLE